ncbi:MAG: transcription antitermination factor NusB [Humidesulfovibrio sp.]|uniref:transcription antitermination factor NusB n=1 Tax=Humidesulfovibrio sp. TaxID=2910988 RepID=UPI0027EEB4C0|nr:transcription antitermination factor NusB [Humidesulfovibrio sp.]MDQ7836718.1 transcription antitermination factor NusB [Humidesulfovibrio sp.]
MAALPPARAAALDCLASCLLEGRDLQAALDTALQADPLSDRDSGLVTELVYGYCRLKGRAEALLARFLDPKRKLPEEAMLALGLAAHEIIHLDRVPAYASVNWAVDWAKGYTKAHLSGLFNAVLRKVADMAPEARTIAPYRENARDEIEALSRFYSCPEWIVELWLKEYPREEAARFLKAQARPPAVGLAVDARAPGLTDQGAEALALKLAGHAACLGRSGLGLAFEPGTSLAALAQDLSLAPEELSALYRQSFAAREALAALEPAGWKTPVWDACAGRGGKTRLLLEAGLSPVLASDTHQGRLKALSHELAHCIDDGRLTVFRARADEPVEMPGGIRPASILIDAPCTGLGTLSRRPDIKWKRTQGDAQNLARTQAAILRQTFETLAPGGTLFYVTCTMNPDENQRQVARFLAEQPGARQAGTWATGPDVPTGEFFYAATLKKVE